MPSKRVVIFFRCFNHSEKHRLGVFFKIFLFYITNVVSFLHKENIILISLDDVEITLSFSDFSLFLFSLYNAAITPVIYHVFSK